MKSPSNRKTGMAMGSSLSLVIGDIVVAYLKNWLLTLHNTNHRYGSDMQTQRKLTETENCINLSSVDARSPSRPGHLLFRLRLFVVYSSDRLWGPPNLLSSGYRRALSSGVQGPGHEADHSSPASAEVKKMWLYTSTPQYAFMA
jgi:hypothetical protein